MQLMLFFVISIIISGVLQTYFMYGIKKADVKLNKYEKYEKTSNFNKCFYETYDMYYSNIHKWNYDQWFFNEQDTRLDNHNILEIDGQGVSFMKYDGTNYTKLSDADISIFDRKDIKPVIEELRSCLSNSGDKMFIKFNSVKGINLGGATIPYLDVEVANSKSFDSKIKYGSNKFDDLIWQQVNINGMINRKYKDTINIIQTIADTVGIYSQIEGGKDLNKNGYSLYHGVLDSNLSFVKDANGNLIRDFSSQDFSNVYRMNGAHKKFIQSNGLFWFSNGDNWTVSSPGAGCFNLFNVGSGANVAKCQFFGNNFIREPVKYQNLTYCRNDIPNSIQLEDIKNGTTTSTSVTCNNDATDFFEEASNTENYYKTYMVCQSGAPTFEGDSSNTPYFWWLNYLPKNVTIEEVSAIFGKENIERYAGLQDFTYFEEKPLEKCNGKGGTLKKTYQFFSENFGFNPLNKFVNPFFGDSRNFEVLIDNSSKYLYEKVIPEEPANAIKNGSLIEIAIPIPYDVFTDYSNGNLEDMPHNFIISKKYQMSRVM